MKPKYVLLVISLLALAGCATNSSSKVVLDASPHRPSWVDSNKLSWHSGGYVYFKATESVLGSDRLNGCYDLAYMDTSEALLRGLADDVKGQINNAQTDISENAELVLQKVRSGQWGGRVTGLTDDEQYFQRYVIRSQSDDTERIDCYVLSRISESNYLNTKRAVVDRLAAVDPRIKEAMAKKEIKFFTPTHKRVKAPVTSASSKSVRSAKEISQ